MQISHLSLLLSILDWIFWHNFFLYYAPMEVPLFSDSSIAHAVTLHPWGVYIVHAVTLHSRGRIYSTRCYTLLPGGHIYSRCCYPTLPEVYIYGIRCYSLLPRAYIQYMLLRSAPKGIYIVDVVTLYSRGMYMVNAVTLRPRGHIDGTHCYTLSQGCVIHIPLEFYQSLKGKWRWHPTNQEIQEVFGGGVAQHSSRQRNK